MQSRAEELWDELEGAQDEHPEHDAAEGGGALHRVVDRVAGAQQHLGRVALRKVRAAVVDHEEVDDDERAQHDDRPIEGVAQPRKVPARALVEPARELREHRERVPRRVDLEDVLVEQIDAVRRLGCACTEEAASARRAGSERAAGGRRGGGRRERRGGSGRARGEVKRVEIAARARARGAHACRALSGSRSTCMQSVVRRAEHMHAERGRRVEHMHAERDQARGAHACRAWSGAWSTCVQSVGLPP